MYSSTAAQCWAICCTLLEYFQFPTGLLLLHHISIGSKRCTFTPLQWSVCAWHHHRNRKLCGSKNSNTKNTFWPKQKISNCIKTMLGDVWLPLPFTLPLDLPLGLPFTLWLRIHLITSDPQAHNASRWDALWACRWSVFGECSPELGCWGLSV